MTEIPQRHTANEVCRYISDKPTERNTEKIAVMRDTMLKHTTWYHAYTLDGRN